MVGVPVGQALKQEMSGVPSLPHFIAVTPWGKLFNSESQFPHLSIVYLSVLQGLEVVLIKLRYCGYHK